MSSLFSMKIFTQNSVIVFHSSRLLTESLFSLVFYLVVKVFQLFNFRFKYVSDNSAVDSSIWGESNTPANRQQVDHCLAISNLSGQIFWADRYCSDLRTFVCEKPPTAGAVSEANTGDETGKRKKSHIMILSNSMICTLFLFIYVK